MQYVVQMRLNTSARPTKNKEGVDFIEQYIFSALALCKKLQEEKKILAGGPTSGAVGLVLIVNAKSAPELDDLITALPVWSRMETQVTPLNTFDARMQSLFPRLGALRGQAREVGTSTQGGGR
jgi:muconolactone delta-isomerase